MTGNAANVRSPLLRSAGFALRVLVALAPWCLSLWLQARLEHEQIWAVDRPFRGLMSVAMLALGMAGSFVLVSRLLLSRRPRNKE